MTYVNGNVTVAYRANAAFDSVHLIVQPTWTIQAVSYDLNYVVASDKLWVYNSQTFQFETIYTFLALPQTRKYSIRNTGGRILVWTRIEIITDLTNATGLYVITSGIQVYMFHHDPTAATKLTLIGVTNAVTHVEQLPDPNSKFGVLSSPQLSKIGFGYFDPSTNTTDVIAKHIDFNNNQWYDLKFSQPQRFLTTIQHIDIQTEIDFNDFYLVARNASYAVNKTSMTNPVVEETYQVVANNMTIMR